MRKGTRGREEELVNRGRGEWRCKIIVGMEEMKNKVGT